MTHDDLREFPEAYVLGGLSAEERHAFEGHLATCPECASAVRELLMVTETLALAVDQHDPPASLRQRVLSVTRTTAEAQSDTRTGFSFLLASEGWQPHVVPGVSFKVLKVERSRGQASLLFKLAPDTHFPGHHHSGPEQCLVLAGDLRAGGRRLGPGDFHYAEAGSDHDVSYSEQGCTLMLIVAAEDYRLVFEP